MKAPKRIYLQTGLERWDDDVAWDTLEEVSWCVDRINDTDVEYVRRDLAALLREAVWQLLRPDTHPLFTAGAERLLVETAWLEEAE